MTISQVVGAAMKWEVLLVLRENIKSMKPK
jgi:hypothetical protein